MDKKKKEKKQELYQILDELNRPIRIKVGYISAINSARVGKIYQSKAAALTAVRNAIKACSTNHTSGSKFIINGESVEKDVWSENLLKAKIRIFEPTKVEEIIFNLDRLK